MSRVMITPEGGCRTGMTRQMRCCYKILTGAQYEALRAAHVYKGSPVDLRDGFIHLSFSHQVAETARKHFSGQDDLWLLEIDSCALGESLRLEPSRGGDLFPHLFRPLRLEDIRWARRLPLVDGEHVLPDLASEGASSDGAAAGPRTG